MSMYIHSRANAAVNREEQNYKMPPDLDSQRLSYRHVLCNLSLFTLLSPQFCIDWMKWDRPGGYKGKGTWFIF